MSGELSASTTTWDTAPARLIPATFREGGAQYAVSSKTSSPGASILTRSTTSTDVRFLPWGAGDTLEDLSASIVMWPTQERHPLQPLARPSQVEERGPFGGRLISLAEACKLADEAFFRAERERQEARERDALYWGDLEEEA